MDGRTLAALRGERAQGTAHEVPQQLGKARNLLRIVNCIWDSREARSPHLPSRFNAVSTEINIEPNNHPSS